MGQNPSCDTTSCLPAQDIPVS